MSSFLSFKMEIPDALSFYLDPFLIELDRSLFGNDAWRILHPLLGYKWITAGLDFLYSLWVPLTCIVWCAVAASRKIEDTVRSQYLWSTIACWIIVGLIAAVVLSSAGPCYTDRLNVDGAQAFVELNTYLAAVNSEIPLSSHAMKEYLWGIHSGQIFMPGGISAMPSMHNAQAILFVLIGFRIDRRLGWIAVAYATLIFVGSIHLAWHYATDGIAGGLMTIAIWYITGFLLARPKAKGLQPQPA